MGYCSHTCWDGLHGSLMMSRFLIWMPPLPQPTAHHCTHVDTQVQPWTQRLANTAAAKTRGVCKLWSARTRRPTLSSSQLALQGDHTVQSPMMQVGRSGTFHESHGIGCDSLTATHSTLPQRCILIADIPANYFSTSQSDAMMRELMACSFQHISWTTLQ
eukprot:4932756-Amphidinium_carterae.1